MFFGDPVAAFTNIARAMCPEGRLVMLVWQPFDRNEYIVAITAALAAGRDFPPPSPYSPGPFSMADPVRVRAVLTEAGSALRMSPAAPSRCTSAATRSTPSSS